MDFSAPFRVKLLQMSDSGGGKTTSIAGVANEGFKTRVIDFDKNLRIIKSYLKDLGLAKNISAIPVDPNDDDRVGHKSAGSVKLMKLLREDWIDPDSKENLGPISSWGTDTVLFVDTGSYMGRMFMRDALLRWKDKNGTYPYDPDSAANFDQTVYNLAQQKFNAVVKDLCAGSQVKCNVVFNMHIKYSEDKQTGVGKYWPQTGIGRALDPDLGKDFTDIWKIDTKADKTKVYLTQGDNRLSLKCSDPHIMKNEEPFATKDNSPLLGVYLRKLLG